MENITSSYVPRQDQSSEKHSSLSVQSPGQSGAAKGGTPPPSKPPGVRLVSLGNNSNTFPFTDYTASGNPVLTVDDFVPFDYGVIPDQTTPFESNREKCPRSTGSVTIVFKQTDCWARETFYALRVNQTCKQWECPVCSKRLYANLAAGLKKGKLITEAKRLFTEGIRHHVKMLTLTCPGAKWRNEHSVEEAHTILLKRWNKLRTALFKRFGQFSFFWTVEPQPSGYPHLHVICVGENVVPYEWLRYTRQLWTKKYGMGQPDLQDFAKDGCQVDKAINYVLKYLRKGMGMGISKKRHHGSSQDGVIGPWKLPMPGVPIRMNFSPKVIGSTHPGVGGDFLYLVHPGSSISNVNELVGELVARGHWDPGGKVLHPDHSEAGKLRRAERRRAGKPVPDDVSEVLDHYRAVLGRPFYSPDEDDE